LSVRERSGKVDSYAVMLDENEKDVYRLRKINSKWVDLDGKYSHVFTKIGKVIDKSRH